MTISAVSGIVISSVDQYVVNTAMPRVLDQLGDPALYAWVAAAFILAQIVGLCIGGAWRDRSGLRVPFMVAVVIFGIGSLSCGFAPTMLTLVAARAFQGLGGGGIAAVCFAAAASYPEGLRLRMFSLISTAWGIVALVGPLLGGLITDLIGWRWIFFVNVPICFAVVFLAIRGFAGAEPADRTRRLPVIRALLLACGAGCIVAAPSAGFPVALPLLVLGAIVAFFYVRAEARAQVPILPLATWTGRGPVGSSLRCTLFFTAAYMGSSIFVPLYVQSVRGESATLAGLVLTVGGISWTAGSILGSQAQGPWPRRMLTIAATLITVDGLFIALQTGFLQLPLILLFVAWGTAALGMGMAMIHLQNWIIVFSPTNQTGTASGASQCARMLGSACGGALMGAILEGVGADQAHLALAITAIFVLVAALGFSALTFARPKGVERRGLEQQASIPKGIEAIA